MKIVSLTTIPPRFSGIGETLASLLAQTVRPDHILLYLPRRYQRFPDYDGQLPEVPEGVEIRVVDSDFGPASKLLPAVQEFRGREVEIMFCDDDVIYPPDRLAALLSGRRQAPDACIAASGYEAARVSDATMQRADQPRAVRRPRKTDIGFQLRLAARKLRLAAGGGWQPAPTRRTIKTAGYLDIFEGFAGVLVRPEFFGAAAFDIPPMAWPVDDVWLSGMAAVEGHPVWAVAEQLDPRPHRGVRLAPLRRSKVGGFDRAGADRACVAYLRETYGIWP